LTAEFAVHAIVNVVDPVTEGFGIREDVVSEWLKIHIVVK
jgi:hypothetical protein